MPGAQLQGRPPATPPAPQAPKGSGWFTHQGQAQAQLATWSLPALPSSPHPTSLKSAELAMAGPFPFPWQSPAPIWGGGMHHPLSPADQGWKGQPGASSQTRNVLWDGGITLDQGLPPNFSCEALHPPGHPPPSNGARNSAYTSTTQMCVSEGTNYHFDPRIKVMQSTILSK